MGAQDPQLALELSKLVGRLGETADGTTREPSEAERLLQSVSHFGDLARVSSDLQAEAVRSAHEAGLSWARIGKHLGISRQAVQQRFDPSYHEDESDADGTRTLGPVSRVEELDHLNAAGAEGWRPIRSLHGQHIMQRDRRHWEVRRVSVLTAGSMPSENDGWRAATTRFPDCFYIREVN
ncbi:hypothetical protein HNR09_000269 [Nesterenkonia xinjiangensis]|uniref:Homeodomain-like domain-containing protein n=1 Tax=Nesterenkonia xinjiangensis TaxID=225327 RepID=A0A7Z0GL44_9MICC|nr:hypothetical protein [Nesterenkonia xinjiangensis]